MSVTSRPTPDAPSWQIEQSEALTGEQIGTDESRLLSDNEYTDGRDAPLYLSLSQLMAMSCVVVLSLTTVNLRRHKRLIYSEHKRLLGAILSKGYEYMEVTTQVRTQDNLYQYRVDKTGSISVPVLLKLALINAIVV